MNNFSYSMIANLTPVKFHPYSSVILADCRFFEIDYTHGDSIDQFQTQLADWFNSCNESFKAFRDNKIVFECYNHKTGQTICFGFYDNTFSVGWKVYSRG